MIYTIGYQAMRSPATLIGLCTALQATLIDCRAASSKRRGFTGLDLAKALGERYSRQGHRLGGFGRTTRDGIEHLRRYDGEAAPNALLVCFEEHPGVCHRHEKICGPHFPGARHVFPYEGVWDYYTAKTITDFKPDSIKTAPDPDGGLAIELTFV